MRTLIIDDSPMARRMIRHYLTKIGCRVVGEAENAAQGLRLLRTLQPDLITMDVMMPEAEGVDSHKALQEMRCAKPDLNAIIVSAVPYEKVRDGFLREGALAYVVKPFTASSFEPARQRLMRVLRQSAARTNVYDRHGMSMIALLDAATIAELREDGDELLIDLIEIFLRETPDRLKMLAEGLAAGDTGQAERMAHTLKSSAASVGAESMRLVALEIESAAHENDLDRVRSLVDTLAREAESAEEALTAELTALAG